MECMRTRIGLREAQKVDQDPWENQSEIISELVSVRMPEVFKPLIQSNETVIFIDANRQSIGNMRYLVNRNKKLNIYIERVYCILFCS